MKTFLKEDEKTGWNAGFSFNYTAAEWEALDEDTKAKTRLQHDAKAMKNAHFTPTTNRGQGGVPNCVVIRAHNLCHDNRQLIVIAINRNRLASKNNQYNNQ